MTLHDRRRPVTLPDAHWPAFLASWFLENGRSLPWRMDPPDPYGVWISEIMLQQTRIETVLSYYRRFMEDYPTVRDLAGAPLEDVLKHWEGLGYYSRARNLFKAAGIIAANQDQGLYPESHGFPSDFESIKALPGIGEYTAGAIGAIAFHLPVTAIDGNVMRVVSRLYALRGDVMLESSRKNVKALLMENYPAETPGAFVQGLMELGELICLPQSPRCESCPLKTECLAREQNLTAEIPVRIPKTKRKTEKLDVYLVRDARGRLLLHQRDEAGVLGGLYELPNVPSGANPSAVLGLPLVPGVLLMETRHIFTHITWNMQVFEACWEGKDDDPLPEGWLFAGEEDLKTRIMLPTAFRKILSP